MTKDRVSLLRARLGEHGLTVASWVKLPAVESVEMLALAGGDAIVIDLEHSMIDLQTVSAQIAVARALGVAPLVRIPSLTSGLLARVLDAGAEGVILPHVDDVATAQALVAAGRFPPVGVRGAGWTSRAGQWGVGRDSYLAFGDQVVLIAQIESGDALRSLGAIASVPGLDGLLFGAADLALDLGVSDSDRAISEAAVAVATAAHEAGLIAATATGPSRAGIDAARADGFDLCVVGNDATMLYTAAFDALNTTKEL